MHLTEPLPCKCRRGTYAHRLIGGIYEVHRWDELSRHGMHTKFHKFGSGIRKLIGGYTDKMEIAWVYFKKVMVTGTHVTKILSTNNISLRKTAEHKKEECHYTQYIILLPFKKF
jgi:hypothetical protein